MSRAKNSRQEEMLRIIQDKRSISNLELSEMFHVTEETIRKDLRELSDNGKILRTFGGAMVHGYGMERSFAQRKIQNYEAKEAIVSAAAKLINSDDLIFMDAGSTVVMLANILNPNLSVKVLTNSLEITNILTENHNASVICTGGMLHEKSMSFQGILTENSISTYNAEVAFISCAAVDVDFGVMDSNEEAARTKRQMIQRSRVVYLLADSSKFGETAHIKTCDLRDISAIVTDSGISAKMKQSFESAGIRIIVA